MWTFPQDFSSLIMSRSLLCADLRQALFIILDTFVHGKSTNIGHSQATVPPSISVHLYPNFW